MSTPSMEEQRAILKAMCPDLWQRHLTLELESRHRERDEEDKAIRQEIVSELAEEGFFPWYEWK